MEKNTYKIGITVYDDWKLLWETHIGLTDKKGTLVYSVWGKTEKLSKDLAEKLLELLG